MLQEDLVLVLLSRDHLIINHQFRDEVLTLSETSLFMEEGRIGITIFQITNSGSNPSNCPMKG